MRADVAEIVHEVAEVYGVTPEDIMGRDRHKTNAKARRMAMWTARSRLDLSWSELGREFGRDHSTVIAAVKGVESWLAANRCA